MMSWVNRYQANWCAPTDPPEVVIQTLETLSVDVNFVGGVLCMVKHQQKSYLTEFITGSRVLTKSFVLVKYIKFSQDQFREKY